MAKGGFAEKEVKEEGVSNAIAVDDLKIKRVELQDYPLILPHGFFVGGERIRQFAFKPYDSGFDLQLSTLYSNPKADVKRILGEFLPKYVDKIGNYTVPEIAKELSLTPQRLFETMPLADALTIVANGRLATLTSSNLSADVSIRDQCPQCTAKYESDPDKGKPYHDIGTIELGIIPQLTDKLVIEVTLDKGIKVGDSLCKTVRLRPLRLYQLKKLGEFPKGKMNIGMMYLQVKEIPEAEILEGVSGQIMDDDLFATIDSLGDRNKLMDASRLLQTIGPDMNVSVTCDNCGWEWDSAVSWGHLPSFLFEPATKK